MYAGLKVVLLLSFLPRYTAWAAGSEVVTGGTTQLHDVPILGIYKTANEGIYMQYCTS